MSAILPYAAIIVLLSLLLVYCDPIQWRHATAYVALVLAVLILAADPMGHAKPTWIEWRSLDGLVVSSAQYHPGEAIYVWTHGPPPRAYVLPWDVDLARKMQQVEGQIVLDGPDSVRQGKPPHLPDKAQ